MPELPEVENMKESLKQCIGAEIIKIELSGKKLRENPDNQLLPKLVGLKITSLSRLAKYIIMNLSNDYVLIFHAGMSGRFEITSNLQINKHDHVLLYLKDGNIIKYNDARRFGLFLISNTKEYRQLKIFKNLGIDALCDDFNAEYAIAKLKKISSNIKNTLLNQSFVAGVGNIYASESLYKAKISPLRPANTLSEQDWKALIKEIKSILIKSIKLGGSTLKDYRKPSGEQGDFQNHFLVYGKDKQNCFCGAKIIKILQNGRSTFYCNTCQK
jgi:formamidopyrimidine-DNA glycosylase